MKVRRWSWEEHVGDTTLGAATCDAVRTSQGGSSVPSVAGVGVAVPHSDTTHRGGGGGPRPVVVAVITLSTMLVWDQYGLVCEGVRAGHWRRVVLGRWLWLL